MCDNHNQHKEGDCFSYADSGIPRVPMTCIVNGEKVQKMVDPTMTLLQLLHNELKLFGTKEGCGEGECGACTINMNGKAVNSCLVLAVEAEGSEILTVEGLAKEGEISTLQKEFIEHDALQCGFCTPGMLMSARALLDKNQNPDVDQVKEAIAGNLCRCTGYFPIVDAILATAKKEREESNHE
jgi:carbon-monoxide dehydrogenase small subunit